CDLLAPSRAEQSFGVEGHHAIDEGAPACIVGGRDVENDRAQPGGQRMGPQRQPGDDTEGPATAAPKGEKQVRIDPAVDGADATVGRYDFGFEQVGCAGPELLREASEAAALNEATDADGEAAAA